MPRNAHFIVINLIRNFLKKPSNMYLRTKNILKTGFWCWYYYSEELKKLKFKHRLVIPYQGKGTLIQVWGLSIRTFLDPFLGSSMNSGLDGSLCGSGRNALPGFTRLLSTSDSIDVCPFWECLSYLQIGGYLELSKAQRVRTWGLGWATGVGVR